MCLWLSLEKEKICDHFRWVVEASNPWKGDVVWSIGSSPILRTGAEEAFPLDGKEQDAGISKLCFDIYHNSNKQFEYLEP